MWLMSNYPPILPFSHQQNSKIFLILPTPLSADLLL